jgi:hypothetical protein
MPEYGKPVSALVLRHLLKFESNQPDEQMWLKFAGRLENQEDVYEQLCLFNLLLIHQGKYAKELFKMAFSNLL